MLSIRPNDSSVDFVQDQHSFLLRRLISRTSKRLAACPDEEIEENIRAAVDSVCSITSTEIAGWFFFSPSGDLADVLHFSDNCAPLEALLTGLRDFPWSSNHLNEKKSATLSDINSLTPVTGNDGRSLRRLGIRSIALLPYGSPQTSERLLVLSSSFDRAYWSPDIVDQCALLESIFFLAYQRKLALSEAAENERRFQQLFRTAAVGMAMADQEDRFLLVNKVFCDIVGYSAEELRLMRYSELSEPFCKGALALQSKRLHRTEVVGGQREQMLLRKNGNVLSARITITLLERSPNERSLSLIMLEDITGQRTAELELNRSRSEVKTLASQLIELQENERKRISRELHDDIGQRLSLAASEVALLERQHSNGPVGLTNRLGTLREDLDSLCTDLHYLSHSLHSYKLQHLGLKPALKDLCLRMSRPDFHVDLIVDDAEDPKSKEVSLCLYRVAQEALNNAQQHAQTSFVAVTLTRLHHKFYMAIQDLGIGFETSANPQGLGLISMKERLKLVNGQLILHSILGRGTEIWVAIPDSENTSDHEINLRFSSIGPQGEAA
ncbi:MAG TPA: PAS domain S-box protein [Edaphobacter sp.]|jgi:PAS domain S-box-containing protein|nr:PAS domain S-box protein [Edaphobacter sp.]